MTPEQLLKIRTRGQRPDGPVCLSLVGRIKNLMMDRTDAVPVIVWRDGCDLRGLMDLWVVVATTQSQRHAIDVIDQVVRVAPNVESWDVVTGQWIMVRFLGKSWVHEVQPLWN